jgi:hypothetical protein
MSGTLQALVFVAIFALAAFLIALPRLLGHREPREGTAADGPAPGGPDVGGDQP